MTGQTARSINAARELDGRDSFLCMNRVDIAGKSGAVEPRGRARSAGRDEARLPSSCSHRLDFTRLEHFREGRTARSPRRPARLRVGGALISLDLIASSLLLPASGDDQHSCQAHHNTRVALPGTARRRDRARRSVNALPPLRVIFRLLHAPQRDKATGSMAVWWQPVS